MSALLYALHLAVLPWLLVGFIRLGKARMANRRGPSLWQPLRDAAKLWRKRETVSETTTWIFRSTPLVLLASIVTAALMVPWLGVPAPIGGDLFLLVYVLAIGRFMACLAALDSGSAFGALGASREAAISVQAEPALVLSLAALAVQARSSDLGAMFSTPTMLPVLIPLLVLALWLTAMAELCRMPIDDPTTHLELTMVHEAMILENSGPNLALVEYASAIKLTLLLGLVGQVLLRLLPPLSPLASYGLSLSTLLAGAGVIVVGEAALVKLRWRRIPNLLSFAVLAALLASLLTALRAG